MRKTTLKKALKHFNPVISNSLEDVYDAYKEKFEGIININIDDDTFLRLFLNSQLYPNLNTKEPDTSLKELHFKSRFNLPKAAQWLYLQNCFPAIDTSTCELAISKKEFNEKGWFFSKNFIDKEEINLIKKQLESFNYKIPRRKGRNITRNEMLSEDMSSLGSEIFSSSLTTEVIPENSPLGKLMTDRNILTAAMIACGSPVYLVGAVSLYTKRNKKFDFAKEPANSPIYWHLDYSHLKFVKVFVLLSDVIDQDYGAHSFVEGSHEHNILYPNKPEYFELSFELEGGYLEGRVKNKWVDENYEIDKIKTFCGNAGDILFENTSGFHRAGICTAGDREVLELIFAISNYGHLTPNRQFQIKLNSSRDTNIYYSPVSQAKRELQVKAIPHKTKRERIVGKLRRLKNNILR